MNKKGISTNHDRGIKNHKLLLSLRTRQSSNDLPKNSVAFHTINECQEGVYVNQEHNKKKKKPSESI